MFIAEMFVFVAFLAVLILCNDFISVSICLFGLGLGARLRLPDRAHDHLGEHPQPQSRQVRARLRSASRHSGAGRHRRRMPRAGAAPQLDAWRWMYATVLIPAFIVTIGRFFVVESANWLAVHGEHEEAEKSITRLLARKSAISESHQASEQRRGSGSTEHRTKRSFLALFSSRNRRATIFASVPWFIQDLSTYGIGIFTPVILAVAIGSKSDHIRSFSDMISDNIHCRRGRGADRRSADRRHRVRRAARRQGGPHLAADLRLFRLCGGTVPRDAVG